MATPGLTTYRLPDGTLVVRMATLTAREDGLLERDWLEARVERGHLIAVDHWGEPLGALEACGETTIYGWGEARDDEQAVTVGPRAYAVYWPVRRAVWTAAQALAQTEG